MPERLAIPEQTVYVVETGEYSDSYIVGIYRTLERAQKVAADRHADGLIKHPSPWRRYGPWHWAESDGEYWGMQADDAKDRNPPYRISAFVLDEGIGDGN